MAEGVASRTVVVSGAGTGIGRAVAPRFARDGDRVVMLGRRQDVLQQAAAEVPRVGDVTPAEPLVLPGDLADPAVAAQVADEVAGHAAGVVVIVSAAGGKVELDRPRAGQRAWPGWRGTGRRTAWPRAASPDAVTHPLPNPTMPFRRPSAT